MRVVQVNYAFDPLLPSARALLDRYSTLTGWAGALTSAGAEVLTVQQFETSSIVTHDGSRYVFGVFNELAEAAAAFRPDVVHVNGIDFALRTWVLRRWLPACPIVVQDHASAPPRLTAIRRQLLSVADAFLFSTVEQAQPWRDCGVVAPRQRVYAIMEASTTLRAVPIDDARSATGVTGDPAVLWIGRLNANKDPVTVLDGFERFARDHREATLTMVFREGDLVDRVRERVVTSQPLRDRVRLAGAVPHDRVAAFCSAADLFVLGSHHEGSGYALLEAMACGATPVVTSIPSFRAIAGEIGFFWNPGDAEACARALKAATLARDRRRIVDHFERSLTWEAVGRRALQIYEEVIRAKGTGQRAR